MGMNWKARMAAPDQGASHRPECRSGRRARQAICGPWCASTRSQASERITRAAPTGLVANENSMLDELLDVSQCRITRALRQRRPLRGRQLPLEAFEHAVNHQPLTLIQRH